MSLQLCRVASVKHSLGRTDTPLKVPTVGRPSAAPAREGDEAEGPSRTPGDIGVHAQTRTTRKSTTDPSHWGPFLGQIHGWPELGNGLGKSGAPSRSRPPLTIHVDKGSSKLSVLKRLPKRSRGKLLPQTKACDKSMSAGTLPLATSSGIGTNHSHNFAGASPPKLLWNTNKTSVPSRKGWYARNVQWQNLFGATAGAMLLSQHVCRHVGHKRKGGNGTIHGKTVYVWRPRDADQLYTDTQRRNCLRRADYTALLN